MRIEGMWRPRIRVLVVDDQALFRTGIASLLSSEEGISVVGVARNGHEGVELASRLLPDVVLMDVRMPGMDGFAAAGLISARRPTVRVVLLESSEADLDIAKAIRAGAVGYVHKDAGRRELVGSVRRAAQGIPPQTAEEFGRAPSGKTDGALPPTGLTARQFQVLRLMSMGLALKQIARELGVTEKTVRNQASLMYKKLRVRDRAHAISYAMRKGIA